MKMILGISTLGHIRNYAITKQFETLNDLLLMATEDCLKFAEDNDIEVCEVVFEPPDIFSENSRQKLIDLCNSFNKIKKQVHAPFIGISLCSLNERISEATVKIYVDSCKISKEINADKITIHPGGVTYPIESILKFNKIQLIKAVNAVLDEVNTLNVNVCLENMPKYVGMFCSEKDVEEFLTQLNRNDLYLTWDTSHSWTVDIDLPSFWKKTSGKIQNIHLVDNNDKETDNHPSLGTGLIDFKQVFELANQYDYKKALIVEISDSNHLRESLNYIKKFF